MFEWMANPEAWVALATLAALEIVLGIDNIIFISILVGRLPEKQRELARFIGLALAMLTRLALLFSIVWIMGLVDPWFTVLGMEISGRDIILVGGGLFLIGKATHEIHNSLEGAEESASSVAAAGFGMVLVQIAILDIVFSLDSVITAVGLVDEISIMAVAIILAVLVMLIAAKPIGDFVDRHPTVKMLALAFLIMVGLTLIVEGFDVHVPKGYIYFAMAFSMAVEMLNLRLRSKKEKRTPPVHLHKALREDNN
ncbi:TerC family protein [Microbulbifer marinus]|uniref:Membrane protein TerC, possibly involved in tellurium resistance n=1 Tax=Microbulbifer marinus TaxID=658218 RepID=A0A1H3YLU2_9GAMM|nr:TerC family protein [Microbulbifer marinus]SEA11994.1 Membrane protein TerC, possibly involved in tellurium resistance [Microbulbifer marinus]